MSKSRFINDLQVQINKRQREIETLQQITEKAIAKKMEEISALETVYRLSNGDTITAVSTGIQIPKKRGPQPGVKRGPYKKVVDASRTFRENLPAPNWRTEVPKVLAGGNILSAREITEVICPGVHKKTRRVQAGRCSAILAIFKKEGLVKEVRDPDGIHVKYTL